MIKPSMAQLVYRALFPRPRSSDPTSLSAHITRNIVPEVRIETANFYGALDSIEAQYPGLDYTFLPHRRRLSRFPNHKKLFKAFDELALTDHEILTLCQWEGTKSAKDKYERDAGRPIRDTTMDGVAIMQDTNQRPRAYFCTELFPVSEDRTSQAENLRPDSVVSQMSDEDETNTQTSVGVQLNQQLRAAADARARGEPVVFDEQFEEWMKEALERSEMTPEAVMQNIRGGRPFLVNPSQTSSFNITPLTATRSLVPTVQVQPQTDLHGSRRASRNGPDGIAHLQALTAQMMADTQAIAASIVSRPPTEAAR